MKWLFKKVKNRSIKLLYNLDREDGFMGMMLAVIMSVAIFTILSSVHIYTVNHARFQSGIKEAYIMQTDIENFATIIAGAYNKGRINCTPGAGIICCPFGSITFKFEGTALLGCNNLQNNICITSSGGREYCLVKLEDVSTSTSFTTVPSITPPIPNKDSTQADGIKANLFDACSLSDPPPPPPLPPKDCSTTYYKKHAKCTNACRDATKNIYPSSHSVNNALTKCCSVYRLSVINCEKMRTKIPAIDCKNYETSSLPGEEKMFCEICETKAGIPKRLFTYYVCPKNTTCNADMRDINKKTKSGVFYQTFRVLAH